MTHKENKSLWTSVNEVPTTYPWLSEDESCEVAIIGGGITGALTALYFAKEGIDTVVVSDTPIGYGAISESSGILHYDSVGSLCALADEIGLDDAVTVYNLSQQAIDSIEELTQSLDIDCGFYRTDSLLYTACEDRNMEYHREYKLRKECGFDVDFLYTKEHTRDYPFEISSAIFSKGMSAVIDPYKFTHAIISQAHSEGARIYEHSPVEKITNEDNEMCLRTSLGKEIKAKRVVIATGTGVGDFIDGMQKKTTFSIATQPIDELTGWKNRCIIRDDDHPEITYSITPDNRILATGLETGLAEVNGKLAGLLPLSILSEKKYEHLKNSIYETFPDIRRIKVEYSTIGSYGKTFTGLPIVGQHPEYPGCIFSTCGGVSGIVHAVITAQIAIDIHKGKPSDIMQVFSPRYKSKK